jgi:hypothetical protein
MYYVCSFSTPPPPSSPSVLYQPLWNLSELWREYYSLATHLYKLLQRTWAESIVTRAHSVHWSSCRGTDLACINQNKTNNRLRGLSPQVDYTNRATTACRRSWCQLLRIDGCRAVRAVDPLQPYFGISRLEPLLFLSSSSSVVLTRLFNTKCRQMATLHPGNESIAAHSSVVGWSTIASLISNDSLHFSIDLVGGRPPHNDNSLYEG